MDGTILSVIGVGVALAAIILNGERAICSEINGLRSEFNSEIGGLRGEVRALGERVARIEGQLAGPPWFLEPPTPTTPSGGERAA